MKQVTSSPSGFTLIELMVALAVLGVLSMLAAPNMSGFIDNQRVKTQAADLFADLNYARSEAIKRNGNVWVRANGSWENGWAIATDETLSYSDCTGNSACVRVSQARDRLTATGPITLVYDRAGRISAAGVQINLCNTAGGARLRTIRVDLSGRPNLTLGDACQAPL